MSRFWKVVSVAFALGIAVVVTFGLAVHDPGMTWTDFASAFAPLATAFSALAVSLAFGALWGQAEDGEENRKTAQRTAELSVLRMQFDTLAHRLQTKMDDRRTAQLAFAQQGRGGQMIDAGYEATLAALRGSMHDVVQRSATVAGVTLPVERTPQSNPYQ